MMKATKAGKTKRTRAPSADSAKEAAGRERRTKLLVALACVGLSAMAVVPFFFMGQSENGVDALELRMPNTHDMFLHYDQMRSFYNGLSAGEIYPRWEEDTNYGFGAPTTSYYPPGIYYLTSACYVVARDWVRALLDAHLLMMIAAAAGLYIYARQAMGRLAAAGAMAAYILLPYHLVDQYHRGAIAELLVFVWMPPMLLFADRLMKTPSISKPDEKRSTLLSMAGLAATYGAFLWSHPPTAYQFTLAFGVYVLTLSVMRKEWKGLVAVGGAMALGIGLSAAYLLPAALEQNLIHKEYILETWPYHKTYIFVHDLYNSEFHRRFFKLIDWIWISGTATIVAAAASMLVLKRRKLQLGTFLNQRVLLWVIVGVLSSFMMTSASMPVGKLIPRIEIGVFTWRMLAITTLVVALLAGAFVQASIDAAKLRARTARLLFASLAGFVIVGGLLFSAIAVVRPMIDAQVFEPEADHLNWATLPSTAPAKAEELPDDIPQAELASENGEVSVEQWKPEHRVIRATLIDQDQLLVRTFNFPGWTATVDGQQTPIGTAEELGDMEIELQAGTHIVTLDFMDTPPRRVCKIITLCSAGWLIALIAAAILVRKVGERVAKQKLQQAAPLS